MHRTEDHSEVGHILINRLIVLFVSFIAVLCWQTNLKSQDKIVLRDLSLITDAKMKRFDVNGIELDDGRKLFWDQVFSGTVKADQQTRFDRFIKSPGETLFQIKTRLKNKSFELLDRPVQLCSVIETELSDENLILLETARFHLSLKSNKREMAIESVIKIALMERRNASTRNRVPAKSRVQFEPEHVLCSELLPVFFDKEEANQVRLNIESMAAEPDQLPMCAVIYWNGLNSSHQGKFPNEWLTKQIDHENKTFLDWMRLFQLVNNTDATDDLARFIENHATNWPDSLKVVSNFHLGCKNLGSGESSAVIDGQLRLLNIAAEFGGRYPEISAASLYKVIQSRGQNGIDPGVESLQKELLVRYPNTHFGSLEK